MALKQSIKEKVREFVIDLCCPTVARHMRSHDHRQMIYECDHFECRLAVSIAILFHTWYGGNRLS